MRNNQPVTQREVVLPEGVTLMSTTDLKSRIQYANSAFVAASGFTRSELMSEPHNIVRHPDMPAEAFADMWQTLQGGDSWTALVKNRRKDGDHYWVRANAAPVNRGGSCAGFISVRTKPSAEDVAAAEQLYQEVREGKARGFAFRKGVLVRRGLLAPLTWARTASVRVRLAIAVAIAILPAMTVAGGVAAVAPVAFNVMLAQGIGALLAMLLLELQISGPLQRVLAQAKSVASGQPAAAEKLERIDEIGLIMRAVQQAGLNLRALVDDVAEQSSQVAVASREIAAGNSDLAERTERSAASLEETAAAIESAAQMLKSSASSAGQANKLAAAAATVAADGGVAVGEMVSTMGEIHESSRRIADIIGVIDGIAFQTNLLALNAAVEAARAGEQGRGFAVVAGEVRELSQRCATAAREVRDLVAASVERVDRGSKISTRACEVMTAIESQVSGVQKFIRAISSAAEEQNHTIEQIRQAMGSLDQSTQQNAAMVEQMAAAAESLRERASQLAEAVEVFSVSRTSPRATAQAPVVQRVPGVPVKAAA